MQRIDGQWIYSATDLNNFLECRRLIELERDVALGERTRPPQDESSKLIARKGEEHERNYLELQDRDAGSVVVFNERPPNTLAGLREAEARTIAAMAEGAALIYQATFFDGEFVGHADFLRRVETPCARWDWSYEVIDTKLALQAKPYFIIQLCNYSEHLERIQGTAPAHGYIVLGSGEERAFKISDYSAYYRHVKRSMLAGGAGESYPLECKHCAICPWDGVCEKQRDDDDHLSIVAAMRRDQIKKLESAGITTLAALAHAGAEQRPPKMSPTTFDYLRAQASQQHLHRERKRSGEGIHHFYKFRPPADELSGFAKLPAPDAADVFFDIEGDPLFRADRGLEYLWGYVCHEEPLEAQPDADAATYTPLWALDPTQEQRAFERFVDTIVARRKDHPGMHVYHYAAYEVTALKRLMGRFGSREREIDELLQQGVFVDLYPIVRQSMWISQPSYSIKKVEAFYGVQRATETKGGDDSIVMFESWLATRDAAILEDIRAYNEDDCRSTLLLRDWLLQRRGELNKTLETPIPFRSDGEVRPDSDEAQERTDLERRFLDALPAPDSLQELRGWNEPMRARWLLGNLLQYHRREDKPGWWKYFERCANPEDLVDLDDEALGGLRLCEDVAPYALKPGDRTFVYTYAFPSQEYRLGTKPVDPIAKKAISAIADIDSIQRRIAVKLPKAIDPAKLRALIPAGPLSSKGKGAAMTAIANAYLDGTLEAYYPATLAVLLNRAPRLRHPAIAEGRPEIVQPATVTAETVSAVVQRLDRSHLFIQGPPGSGKSTIGAAVIVDLLQAGKRVGIVANSHKAVHNLLRKIEETAKDRNFRFGGCHKESETDGSTYHPLAAWPMVQSTDDIEALLAEDCRLAAGTTFAWSDERLRGRFDYVFIDEAGQVSLADALIVSLAASNLVLLGDPQQLPQVSQGSHPIGCDASVLEHLLGAADTVPEDRGIFLDKTYRLHPAICAFLSDAIYEGRLRNDPSTARNTVTSAGLSGNGLVYIPVEHEGNSRRSDEEAARIVHEIALLLHGTVAIRERPERPMTECDILVVAPYNVQRIRIRELLDAAGHTGVQVGTVDKFQGQEAPVVLYSMATSSHADMPRTMQFLFDRNRFNVAVSRAQAMSVLVCSPALLDARCNAIKDVALVNLLCEYVDRLEQGRRIALPA